MDSYVQRLYASGRKDLADRVAASLVNQPTEQAIAKAAGKPVDSSG